MAPAGSELGRVRRTASGGVIGVRTAAIVLVCAALGGCSPLGTPGRTTSTQSSPVAQAQSTHEYPSPPSPAQTATGGAATAVQAIRAFATEYINWTADTVAVQMRSLASQSVSQARAAMQLAAAQTAQDYELQRGGIANTGTVEAVVPLIGHHDQYVVVTRELTSATNTTAYEGLRPAWHLALATVVQLRPGQWVLSRWQPES
jgi:hypothetical protein